MRGRRPWRWALAVLLLALAGCTGAPVTPSPAVAPPSSCVDQFSGRIVRGCL